MSGLALHGRVALLTCAFMSVDCYAGQDPPADRGESAGAEESGGNAEEGGGESGPPPADTSMPDPPPNHDAADDVECDEGLAPSPWLKLSTGQYRNTVRDLLRAIGADAVIEDVEAALASIPADSLGQGFRGLDDRISAEHVQGYFAVAKAVGDAFERDPSMLEAALGECADESSWTDDCVGRFIEAFAVRAYRRPLTDDEAAKLQALDDGERSPGAVLRVMAIVVLNSPHFLTHVEVHGAPASETEDVLDLSPYELASRLSYTFWQTMPDDALLAAAADGSLATADGFLAQLDRVFADDRTRETLWEFWREWLRLENFTGFEETRPGFRALVDGEDFDADALYAAMVDEVRALTELHTFERSASLVDLMTTDVSVTPSSALASVYGVEPWDGEGEYPRLPADERAGLFQRAALLVNALETTNPFHRGAFVRRHLLCDPLPQPDPNALPPGSLDPPPFDDTQSTRERFTAKVDNALCRGCHVQFSDIGYVLEAYDSLGRYRTVERVFDEKTGEVLAELPIDLATVPRITSNDEEVVASVSQLNEKLVESGKVQACLAQNFYRFVMRRALATSSQDTCVADDLADKIGDPELGLAAAFKHIARYPSFLQRKVGEP